MTTSKNIIAIHFSAYAFTNYGETVCLVGNCSQLGMWDPKKGLNLQTNPKQYPIWFSKKPLTLQKLTNLQYKFCIVDKDNCPIRWENLKQNRFLSLKTSCSIFLTQGEVQAEYDFQNSDTTSTQINSSKKPTLSEIQEQSDDDQPNQTKQGTKHGGYGQERKRSGSSIGRSSKNYSKELFFQSNLIKFQSNIDL